MELTKLERADFLAWIGGERMGKPLSGSSTKLRRGEVLAVSERNGMRGVLLVVADDEEVLDFYAFVSTYISTYSPFSAFFRVVTLAEFERSSSSIGVDDEVLRRALAGVVICQSLGSVTSRRVEDLELAELLSSESFALAKGMLGGQFHSAEDLSERWRHAANLINRGAIPARPEALGAFWHEVQSALFKDPALIPRENALRKRYLLQAILQDRRVTERVWQEMLEVAPFLVKFRSDMEGAREKRARVFTSAAQSPEMHGLGSDADLVVAFLGVLLAGASFEYAMLMTGLSSAYPAAPQWFGFIAGAMANSDVLTIGKSLGRHLVKRMEESSDLGRPPVCDIAFNELRVIARGRGGLDGLPTRSKGSVRVEIIPGTSVDISKLDGRGASQGHQSATLSEVRRLVQQLQRVLSEDGSREGDLFDSGSRKKSPRR